MSHCEKDGKIFCFPGITHFPFCDHLIQFVIIRTQKVVPVENPSGSAYNSPHNKNVKVGKRHSTMRNTNSGSLQLLYHSFYNYKVLTGEWEKPYLSHGVTYNALFILLFFSFSNRTIPPFFLDPLLFWPPSLL